MKALLLIATLALVACDKTPDEEKIRGALNEIEIAVQNRQTRPVLKHLSKNFTGPEGMTVRQIRQLMAAHYFRNKNIQVVIAGLSIKITGIDADVRFNAATTGGTGLLPERLQYYDVETTWQKIDNDWRIVRADWTPVLGAGG
ncbi:MAG: hypothetical protein ACC641_06650 [Acidiferrobacterales bacterium]